MPRLYAEAVVIKIETKLWTPSGSTPTSVDIETPEKAVLAPTPSDAVEGDVYLDAILQTEPNAKGCRKK